MAGGISFTPCGSCNNFLISPLVTLLIAFKDYTNKCINKVVSKQCQGIKNPPRQSKWFIKIYSVICPWTFTHQEALYMIQATCHRKFALNVILVVLGDCLFLLSNFDNNSSAGSDHALLIIFKNDSGIFLIGDIEKWALRLPCWCGVRLMHWDKLKEYSTELDSCQICEPINYVDFV